MLNPDHLKSFFESIYEVEEYDAEAHMRAPLLGGSPFDGCLDIPIKNVLPQICRLTDSMRRRNLSNSSFAPDSIRAGFPIPSGICSNDGHQD